MRLICICLLLLLFSRKEETPLVTYVKDTQVLFAAKADKLQQAVAQLDEGHPETLIHAKDALKECRISYKRLSFFLEYFFSSEAYVFNSPAKYEIDEPYIEYETPVGLQQIEALLYDSAVYDKRTELLADAEVVANTAADIPSLLYRFTASEAQLKESVQQELTRINTLYITGYDAPFLKSGIEESLAALEAIQQVTGKDLKNAISYLKQHPDFNTFDRLEFLTVYALPLQPFLFKPVAVRGDTSLGRKLFFEKALSGSNTRSCATCHQPDKFFSDGLVKNSSLEGGLLPRNTPGLTYTAYQHAQFWDGRAKSLEEQIMAVMHSKQEMDAVDDTVLHRLKGYTMPQIVSSLAAYVSTLGNFSSPFDRYIAGDHRAMTTQQQHGFNLFMGKGQCGTCHFAPVFNGSTPPLYERTEFEVLGVPEDKDPGRFSVLPIDLYYGAFKTPSVRNTAVTAPYMHNGVHATMEEVIDFYNNGGMHVPNQTLSDRPLQLDSAEKKAIIAFMTALTDQP